MDLIKVERFFKTIKHPMGDGLYMKIGLEFKNEKDAEKFKCMEMSWEEGVEAVEISQEEYQRNTEED